MTDDQVTTRSRPASSIIDLHGLDSYRCIERRIIRKHDERGPFEWTYAGLSLAAEYTERGEHRAIYERLAELQVRYRPKPGGVARRVEYHRSPYWAAVRALVFERDGCVCVVCGTGPGRLPRGYDGRLSVRGLELDHITPISAGGKTSFANLQTLCSRCNNAKGTRH